MQYSTMYFSCPKLSTFHYNVRFMCSPMAHLHSKMNVTFQEIFTHSAFPIHHNGTCSLVALIGIALSAV
ncbi:hypothetical protein XELAEV_18043607mg [Xenopus laevis]|uniref:Uncharacterized protein n=1 Tax=Xenopus laevis TaxID=8355 RepID=A0A974H2I1_XENLA|nr:hypothetical protein XELAEV_18043607mg [Xenopus laevis]